MLEHDVAGTMEVVAKDVKLQLELNPAVVASYRLIGYDNRRMDNSQFSNDEVDSGEIGSGHAVTALYEITLVDSPLSKSVEHRYQTPAATPLGSVPEGTTELGFLKIRFKAPDGDRSELLEFPLAKSAVRPSLAASSDDFRFATAVSAFGTLLRKSSFAGSYSFADVAALADGARGKDTNGKRKEFCELVKNAAVAR